MSRLHARVLLDTGPSQHEAEQIRGLFARTGMSVDTEGHSYGGPPPSSAFLIVVNVPLAAFLAHFTGPEPGGCPGLADLLRALAGLRADPGVWGRAHRLKLEDATSNAAVLCPPGLPQAALEELTTLDVAGFDRSSPPVTLVWSGTLRRWQAEVLAGTRTVLRRAPRRRPGARPAVSVRQLSAAEHGELGRITDDRAGSVIRWQRAQIVLLNSLGWSTAAVATQLLLTEQRVRDVIANFNEDGFPSLEYRYTGGRQPEHSPEEERDARAVAGAPPGRAGLTSSSWDDARLAEVLVRSGITGDVSPGWVAALRADRPHAPSPGHAGAAYQHVPG